ncbi:MAG: hypothetical protein IKQ96_10040 [Lachnospiraceae bacterium]|nr:hypothetical protein [Lachnospiraceae bacterium]
MSDEIRYTEKNATEKEMTSRKGEDQAAEKGAGSNFLTDVIFPVLIIFSAVVTILANVLANPAGITRSTVQRVRQEEARCERVETWYQDDWGNWIAKAPEADQKKLTDAMDYFYERTGVQPYLWIIGEQGADLDTEEKMEEAMTSRYEELFTDAGHLLFVLCEYPNSSGSYKTACLVGRSAGNIMDPEAREILRNYVDLYYKDASLSETAFFAKAFENAANRIMTKSMSEKQLFLIYILMTALILGTVARCFLKWKEQTEVIKPRGNGFAEGRRPAYLKDEDEMDEDEEEYSPIRTFLDRVGGFFVKEEEDEDDWESPRSSRARKSGSKRSVDREKERGRRAYREEDPERRARVTKKRADALTAEIWDEIDLEETPAPRTIKVTPKKQTGTGKVSISLAEEGWKDTKGTESFAESPMKTQVFRVIRDEDLEPKEEKTSAPEEPEMTMQPDEVDETKAALESALKQMEEAKAAEKALEEALAKAQDAEEAEDRAIREKALKAEEAFAPEEEAKAEEAGVTEQDAGAEEAEAGADDEGAGAKTAAGLAAAAAIIEDAVSDKETAAEAEADADFVTVECPYCGADVVLKKNSTSRCDFCESEIVVDADGHISGTATK